jgi:hypothetical protein
MTTNLVTKPPIQRSKQIRRGLRLAIEAMIWQSARRSEAAAIGGMTDHSLRAALKKPHVKAALMHEMEVLKTSERPRNISALVNIRDFSENDMARLGAAKTLEAMSEESTDRARGTVTLPGLIIEIHNPSPADRAQDRLVAVTPPTIDAEPVRQIEPEPPRSDSFISIDEIAGAPQRDDPPPLVEEPPLLREPRAETLDQFRERLLAGVPRLAPASMGPAPLQPYDKGYVPPQPRGGPRASRFRARRGD